MGGRANANLHLNYPAGLRGTTRDAKIVYTRLLSDDALNHAGVLPLRVALWADECEMTEVEVYAALQNLEEHRFAYTDYKTHQVLVRTLIRNDGIADMPNVLWSACRCALNLRSEKLRRVLAGELRKLAPQPPDKVNEKTSKRYVYPDPHGTADKIDPGPPTGGEQGSLEPLGTLPNPSQGSPTPGGGGGGGGKSPVAKNSSSSKPSRPAADGPPRDDVDGLCKHLRDRIVNNGSKPPTAAHLKGWRTAARLMLDRDKRDLAEAHRLIDWCQADHFWRSNIGGMPKFREQYDQLRLKAAVSPSAPRRDVATVPDTELTDDDVDEILGPGRPPEPPDEFEFWDRDRRHAWNRENYRQWQAGRRARAVQVRAERLARVTRLDDHRRDAG